MIPKKLASRLAALLAACCLLSVPALAAETGELALPGGPAPKLTQLSFPEGEDNDALFSAYVSQRLFANAGVSPASAQDPAGNRLEGVNKTAYGLLKAKIEATASSGGSAMYTLTSEDLGQKTQWTREELTELGYEIPENPESSEALNKALQPIMRELFGKLSDELDAAAVENALLLDCPFDLYWFDKTLGTMFQAGTGKVTYENDTLSMPLEYSFYYRVAESYRGDGYVQLKVDEEGNITANLVVTTDVSRVNTAAEKAADIVTQHQNESDYDKLLAYRDEICALTAYNHAAANTPGTAYGDPWQLIYVFDGDPNTNVVCEGYAKAFQYLCDLTAFGGDAACYLVEGTMAGGTGAGPHMWNIVRIDGQSYLVDVTNSDEGSIGQDGGLFLAGTAELTENENGSVFVFRPTVDSTITYQYDSAMFSTWDVDVLTLAAESYSSAPPPPPPPETGEIGTVTPPEGGGKLSVRVSGSVGQPSWLLAAGYDGNNRLTGVFPVKLSVAGAYDEELTLPAGTVSFKVLLTGGESWAPLCGAESSGSQ